MTSSNLERIMGRAILDRGFGARLFANPELAVCEGGFCLDDTEMKRLTTAVGQIKAQKSLEQIIDELANSVFAWWP